MLKWTLLRRLLSSRIQANNASPKTPLHPGCDLFSEANKGWRAFSCSSHLNLPASSSSASSSSPSQEKVSLFEKKEGGKDAETLFLEDDVQRLLKQMTHFEVNRIFEPKPVGKLRSPRYLFMTDDELQMALDRAKERGEQRLEMPPFMSPWKEETQVLANDPELQGFEESNLVFTDISPGFSDRNRIIAVREPTGRLRRAYWEERYRMNQTYFPVPERCPTMPKMFEPDHLETVLERKEYLFILERACLQMQPDDPQYIRVTHRTYDHISETKGFHDLRSTRHFGPMCFYLALTQNIDALLLDMIQRELMSDALHLIKLYYIVNISEEAIFDSSLVTLDVIKFFVKKSSKKRHFLELGLQAYEELQKQRSLIEDHNDNKISSENKGQFSSNLGPAFG